MDEMKAMRALIKELMDKVDNLQATVARLDQGTSMLRRQVRVRYNGAYDMF
ncbi:unknown [Feldmannia species virus]|uniref:Uncharacterized protein n=1 Tax=Feldmannia species virus TaxID=39420 RepID=B5LWA3_9PHYC|nr:hypothetical protein FeldSpV_gp014 [Feldmannia species virus]ACH46766.1 unknown [Feldmannia species virus]